CGSPGRGKAAGVRPVESCGPGEGRDTRTSGVRSSRLTLKGKVAYVPDLRDGLQVVDLSNAATPRVVATYRTAEPVRDVAVAGSLIYVGVGPPWDGNKPAGAREGLALAEDRNGAQ